MVARRALSRPVALTLFTLAWCLPAAATDTWDPHPFDTFNQSPLIQIYGLPAIGNARVTARGVTAVGLSESIANNYTGDTRGNEYLLLDGETYRTNFTLKQGVGRDIEIGLELPYLSHRGGHLDGFIEGWHDFFGLPQGGRQYAPHNHLNYEYRRDGVTRVRVTDVHTGIGDIRATGAYQLLDSRTRLGVDVALRGSLKLPTGDEANLYGSGGTDLALWLSAACEKAMCGDITGWYGGAGLLWVGKGEVLPELQREHVLFGVFGWAVRALPDITLKAQLDMHSPFYGHTELEQLNTGSVELQLGGSWALTRNTVLDIAVAEDMVVSTAPDVTFHLALRYRY